MWESPLPSGPGAQGVFVHEIKTKGLIMYPWSPEVKYATEPLGPVITTQSFDIPFLWMRGRIRLLIYNSAK